MHDVIAAKGEGQDQSFGLSRSGIVGKVLVSGGRRIGSNRPDVPEPTKMAGDRPKAQVCSKRHQPE
jgi:hypothetical protein